MRVRLILLLLLAGGSLIPAGCTPVQPWEKESLARPAMALEPDSYNARYRQHIYRSREATGGGYGVGGGGCGCN